VASQATAHAFVDDGNASEPVEYLPRHARIDVAPDKASSEAARSVPARHLAPLLPDRDLASNRIGAKSTVRALSRFGRGDESVAKKLTKLPGRWRILHSIPVGHNGTDVDHVLVGPGGVFTVTVTRVPEATVWASGDSVTVDGQYQPFVRNGRFEARRAGRLLSAATSREVHARCLLVLVGAAKGGVQIQEQPRDGTVVLVAAPDLIEFLTNETKQLDDGAVDALYAAARHLSTWQPSTVRWEDF